MANWWQDPPKNSMAGGYITRNKQADTTELIDTYNSTYFCGFTCHEVSEWFGYYHCNESSHYNTFIKFGIPQSIMASGVSYVGLTLKVANAEFNITDEEILGHPIHVYTTDLPSVVKFPYEKLGEADVPLTDWNYAGVWENITDIYDEVTANGPYWLPFFDVTSGFMHAIDSGYPFLAIRLRPMYDSPYTWNYYHYPGWDQKSYVSFYGAAIGTYCWQEMPEGFPTASGLPTPWLKIVCNEEQQEPGDELPEAISCINSDYKSHSALIGTTKGGLWRTWDYGNSWAKIFETPVSGNAITTVHMDTKKNIVNYPNNAIAYFGTASGELYQSVDGMQSWTEIYDFPSEVVEVMASDENSDKVVVLAKDGVYTSIDGGVVWDKKLSV
jgi:hypothetical protein